MKDADTRKMILVPGMMAFWCNGENYAAAPLLVEKSEAPRGFLPLK